MPADFPEASILLLAPFRRHLVVHCIIDAAVELVDIHGTKTLRETIVFSLQPTYRLVVLLSFIGMALLQPRDNPLMDALRKMKSPHKLGEFLRNDLFTDIGLVTFPLVAGAMIIDVAAFFDLADQGTAAMPAIHKTRKGKLHRATPQLAVAAVLKPQLNSLPEIVRDQRLVTALDCAAMPLILAGVKPIAKNVMYLRGANRTARNARREALGACHLRELPNRIVAGDVPFEELSDRRAKLRVNLDDLFAFRIASIEIADWRASGPIALLGLLRHALASFFG